MNKPPGAQAAAAAAPAAQNTTEYTVRVPKASRRKFNMMRFHQALGVDFKQWSMAKMERENNQKEFRSLDDEMPKFGAGSEYGRDQREEARRKKYGINMRKYISENQPWLLTVGGKNEKKKFKGIREGGVSENSSWYVFMQGKDGAFEAFPVEEWYNFKMIQRYNTLTAEEAEEQFENKDKKLSFCGPILAFNEKMRQKLKNKHEFDPKKKKYLNGKILVFPDFENWYLSVCAIDGSSMSKKGKNQKNKVDFDFLRQKTSKNCQKKNRKKSSKSFRGTKMVKEGDNDNKINRERLGTTYESHNMDIEKEVTEEFIDWLDKTLPNVLNDEDDAFREKDQQEVVNKAEEDKWKTK
ncbi:unnamed protein product [Meganyctiphanes norvegica]|uniref:Transcription initiation factor IIF subunit alpha n=1 Tax=Meganyctiphanes norvegica TaxID=48144 RepID=A0AAV2S545_MEGNR